MVAFIRKLYDEKRVGHAGTLDPAAAGVLPVFIGQATRLIEYSAGEEKSYRAEISWGYETDTGDDTGKIIFSAPCVVPDFDRLNGILHSFLGVSEQIPPMYSAVKIGGKKLYELAREGMAIERPARTIEIRSIALKRITDKKAIFDVTCSKGTYIRVLCADIGKKAGCPAVMSFLVRTRVGSFSLLNANTLEEISQNKYDSILPLDFGLDHMPKLVLSINEIQALGNGQRVRCSGLTPSLFRIHDAQDRFMGIARNYPGSEYLIPEKNIFLD